VADEAIRLGGERAVQNHVTDAILLLLVFVGTLVAVGVAAS